MALGTRLQKSDNEHVIMQEKEIDPSLSVRICIFSQMKFKYMFIFTHNTNISGQNKILHKIFANSQPPFEKFWIYTCDNSITRKSHLFALLKCFVIRIPKLEVCRNPVFQFCKKFIGILASTVLGYWVLLTIVSSATATPRYKQLQGGRPEDEATAVQNKHYKHCLGWLRSYSLRTLRHTFLGLNAIVMKHYFGTTFS